MLTLDGVVVVYNDVGRNVRADGAVGRACVVQLIVLGLHVGQLVDTVRISTETLSTRQERGSRGKRWHVGKFTYTRRLGASG